MPPSWPVRAFMAMRKMTGRKIKALSNVRKHIIGGYGRQSSKGSEDSRARQAAVTRQAASKDHKRIPPGKEFFETRSGCLPLKRRPEIAKAINTCDVLYV